MQNTSLHQEIRWPDPKEITLIDLPLEPKMRIYNGSNPNRHIEESNENIMKAFIKHLENNQGEISKLSTSNIKVSYEILAGNNLSLSFDFEPSNPQNQDSITFINTRNKTHIITKNADIKKLEEERQIILTYSDSESTKASHIFTPQEVSKAIKEYVKTKGEIPTHNLIITTDENRKLSFKESSEKVKNGEYFVVKSINDNYNLEIGSTTKKVLTQIITEAKKEAEDRAKKEAEEKDKQFRQLFDEISCDTKEIEKLFEKLMKKITHQAVPEIAEKKEMPMTKEIESEITKIVNVEQSRLSALNLIESTDYKQSQSAIASINKSTFDCVRSSQKENNFYKILTENGEAKQLLIAYLAEYDDGEKSEKLDSLVKLIVKKNNTYKEPQSPSADKAKIMEDLIIDLGTKILANFDMATSELEGNIKAIAESNALENTEQERRLKELKPAITNKLSKTTEKLTEFLEKTGNTEELLRKIIAERSPDSQLNANSATNLSATQTNVRS